MAKSEPCTAAKPPTVVAPANRPRSPTVRMSASAGARDAGGTRLATLAVGAEPRKVPPAAHTQSTASACGMSCASGNAIIALAEMASPGAITLRGPTRSASAAEGAAPSTEMSDCTAKQPPISAALSANLSPASMRGSRVMFAPVRVKVGLRVRLGLGLGVG
eukprot:scaffold74660_cov72-Phaeocystis_antarctica.AAC.2